MSRKLEVSLELVYESLDILAHTDSDESDKVVDKLARVAAFLEGEISGADDYIDPDDDDSVAQYELDFNR